MKASLVDSQQSLTEWVNRATGVDTTGIQVRMRGNDLHILFEGKQALERTVTILQLIKSLQVTNLGTLISDLEPPIYQVFVYDRRPGQKLPNWCQRLDLNQLDRHKEQFSPATIETGGAIIVSNESLARQGNPDAIARYLSETLSTLGVAVQVQVKQMLGSTEIDPGRLWILCQSIYSPDPALLALPVAEKLRSLRLEGFHSAVLSCQVSGESTPDWTMRVDLTPHAVMLKEWARWGDVQALTRLLNESLEELKVEVQASLQEVTLHLFCKSLLNDTSPEQIACMQALAPVMNALAPQGIQAATIYGQTANDEDTPAWIDWLTLPATEHPALAVSPLVLASSGDEMAIDFLLSRLLNPDIDWRLATGGIRILLRRKADLLHVMCDAPVCPKQNRIAAKVVKLLHQLKVPAIAGVRVYGRRAGDKKPTWNYGRDFESRERLVPEPAPEFAVTTAYVSELFPVQQVEVIRQEVTTQQIQSAIQDTLSKWGQKARKFLLESQLFQDGQESAEPTDYPALKVALVWSVLGLLVSVQADWLLGRFVAPKLSASVVNKSLKHQETGLSGSLTKSRTGSFFNASGFTQADDTNVIGKSSQGSPLAAEPLKQKANATAIVLAARSSTPTFNSRQLDEQLALYRQRIAEAGNPPDVLIIGSSRALRGVDPVALSSALTTQGYRHLKVFNFGVNGATAQIVDLIVRQILKPSELPKVIVWADGSRAFNSGRQDVTFNTIAASPGYKQAQETISDPTTPNPKPQKPTTKLEAPESQPTLTTSWQNVNQLLNQTLGGISASYPQRSQVKTLVSQSLKSMPGISEDQMTTNTKQSTDNPEADVSSFAVDFDGFLPLSIRFNPTNYYQQHPKVSGSYDSDYYSFTLAGAQDSALQSLLEFSKSRQIPLIFINLPLTQTYLDPVRAKYEQDFHSYMLSLATNKGLIYRDISHLWPKTNEYFSDPSHLNRYGAYEVSQKLAVDPMIPWPTKSSTPLLPNK